MTRFKLVLTIAALMLAACGGPLKYEIPSTPKAPGADAKLVADVKQEQKITLVELVVANLAPPSRVAEGSTQYVAWQRKNDTTTWSRIGNLQYDDGSRKGKLTGSVPEIAFDFEVTAEQSVSPASPSPEVVFAQRVAK